MVSYVHRSMVVGETIKLALHIDKFSQVVCSGRYECQEFGDAVSGNKWSLEVNGTDADDYENFIDIYLRRCKSDGADLFVELKLTIDDRFGVWGLSKKQPFSFKDSTYIQKVMSVNNSWFNKLLFTPKDTLTIRGELTMYREDEKKYENESEFEKNLRKSTATQNLGWIVVRSIAGLSILFVGLLLLSTGLSILSVAIKGAYYAILNAISHFLHDVVLPFIGILIFFTWFFLKLRKDGESALRKGRRSEGRHWPNFLVVNGELVPVTNGKMNGQKWVDIKRRNSIMNMNMNRMISY